MKIEYTAEIKKLILDHYDPVDHSSQESEYTEKKSLRDIYMEVCNILPSDWVYESDVYDILVDLGFKSFPVRIEEIKDPDDPDKVIFPRRTIFLYFLDRKTAAI